MLKNLYVRVYFHVTESPNQPAASLFCQIFLLSYKNKHLNQWCLLEPQSRGCRDGRNCLNFFKCAVWKQGRCVLIATVRQLFYQVFEYTVVFSDVFTVFYVPFRLTKFKCELSGTWNSYMYATCICFVILCNYYRQNRFM